MKQSTREQKVEEFHKCMKINIDSEIRSDLIHLRSRLILEEAQEVAEALGDMAVACAYQRPVSVQEKTALLKELCDLQYVLSGTIVAFKEFDTDNFDVAFNRVHQSNMSKLDDNSCPVYDIGGKVLKGPNYTAPDLTDLVI